MGSASGYITALVLALYINSDKVRILYKRPEILWVICPLILYWVSRAWLIARRGQENDDPVVFAIKDLDLRYRYPSRTHIHICHRISLLKRNRQFGFYLRNRG